MTSRIRVDQRHSALLCYRWYVRAFGNRRLAYAITVAKYGYCHVDTVARLVPQAGEGAFWLAVRRP